MYFEGSPDPLQVFACLFFSSKLNTKRVTFKIQTLVSDQSAALYNNEPEH